MTLSLAVLAALSCGLQEYPQGETALAGTTDAGRGGRAADASPAGSAGNANPNGAGGPSGGDVGTVLEGVDIDGTRVPREKAIVILHFGHSNMSGAAQTPTELLPFFYDTQPYLWSYQGAGLFVPAKEQTAPSTPNRYAGPGMAILRTLAAAAPPGTHFISIARAQGSAPSASFLKGGLYYSAFMDRAMELKGKVTFGGIWIMLGNTDRHMPLAEQGGFADRMTRIVADIRADLGEPNLPVLHTDYEVESTGSLSVDSPFAQRIRPLILSLPERISRCAIVPTDDLPMQDNHHFDLAGHKLWVERGMRILSERGWLPWGERAAAQP